jgi:hypothetical protein
MSRRPTSEVYQQALDYYRTGTSIETIGERLGLDAGQLEQLEHDGWPAGDDGPKLLPLRAQVLERLTRVRAGELDTLAAVADSGGRTAPIRASTAHAAAKVENAILMAWMRKVSPLVKGQSEDPSAFALSKPVLDTLLALRRCQDISVDLRYARFFAISQGGKAEDGDGDSWEAAIVRDLAELSPEDLDEYVRTSKLPSRQRDLFEDVDAA